MRALALVLILAQLTPSAAGAAERARARPQPRSIPSQPSVPPSLTPPEARDYFHCERSVVVDGKKYQCDSYGRPDSERLRLFVKDLPEAMREIDLYQATRISTQNVAYVASSGVFVILLGALAAGVLRNSYPRTGNLIRDTALLGGLWVAINAFMYGVSAKRDNEHHLNRAVEIYNRAHPDKPMELQFEVSLPVAF